MAIIQYVSRDTIVHRMNPVTKIFITFVITITAIIFKDIVSLIIIFGITMILWILARVSIMRLKVLLAATLGMILLFIVCNGFWWWQGKTVLFTVPFFDYRPPFISFQNFYLEGFIQGIGMGIKLFTLVCVLPLLLITTPLTMILRAFAWARVPYKFNFILTSALRFAPLVSRVYMDCVDAQKLRAHDIDKMNLVSRLRKAYIPVAVPLILSLLKKSDEFQISIESRAFGAPVKRTFVEEIRFRALDYMVFALFIGFFLISVINYILFGQLIPPELLSKVTTGLL